MDSIQSQTSKWWGAGLSVMDVFKMRNGRTLLLDLRYIHWNKGYNLSGQLLIRKALHLGQCYRNNFQCLRLRRVFEGHFWWEEPGARYITSRLGSQLRTGRHGSPRPTAGQQVFNLLSGHAWTFFSRKRGQTSIFSWIIRNKNWISSDWSNWFFSHIHHDMVQRIWGKVTRSRRDTYIRKYCKICFFVGRCRRTPFEHLRG